MGIGVANKITLLFDKVFWTNELFQGFLWKYNDKKLIPMDDLWTTKIFAANNPSGCNKALTLWTSGDGAKLVESLPDDVVKAKSMEVIRRFMGKGRTIPDPVEMIKSSWYANPYTRGSYTYDNIESPQHPTARSDLGLPITDAAGSPRLLFAGEATDVTHFSTVHGAVDSGFREAKRLLEHSKL